MIHLRILQRHRKKAISIIYVLIDFIAIQISLLCKDYIKGFIICILIEVGLYYFEELTSIFCKLRRIIMSKFKAFMKGEDRIKTKKVYISDRFIDDNGDIVPFVISTITPRKLKECRKQAEVVLNGETKVDNEIFESELLKATIIYPDLKDVELQDSYGALGEINLLEEMLTAGEYNSLTDAIQKFNHFTGYKELVEKAKN